MTKAEFIKELAQVLMVDDPSELTPQTELSKFEAWDSTAVLNLIVLLDEQGVTVEEEKIPDCKTVQDVMDLAGGALTD
jgi:acyl carrier protein